MSLLELEKQLADLTALKRDLQEKICALEREAKSRAYLEYLFRLTFPKKEALDNRSALKRLFLKHGQVKDLIIIFGYCYRDIANCPYRIPVATTSWLKDLHRLDYPDERLWYKKEKCLPESRLERIFDSKLLQALHGDLGDYSVEKIMQAIYAAVHYTLFDERNILDYFPDMSHLHPCTRPKNKGQWECFVLRNHYFAENGY